MKTAIYCRVSTTDQSTAPQLMELRAYAALKQMEIVEEISDVVSGAKSSRDGLNRLFALIREKKIETVLCVKLDRLGRSLSHLASLVDFFEKANIALICTSQGIDTSKSNACGRFQLSVLSAVAAFERELIRERTKAGLAVARANGKILGKPSKVLVPDWRERVVAWKKETGGVGLRALRVMLGGVSLSTAAICAKT